MSSIIQHHVSINHDQHYFRRSTLVDVIIAGAGEVGSNIAAGLADSNEVVVIDPDPARIETITYSLDVLAIEGKGTSLSTLREAGVEDADIVIGSAAEDETNLAVCGTAKVAADPFTIARVKSIEYLTTWETRPGAYGVDFMVCTDLLTAEDIVRSVGLPAATDSESFANDAVRMAEFPVPEGNELAHQTIEEADRFDRLTFAALITDGETTVARGSTVIEPGSKLVVIGTPDGIQDFATVVNPDVGSAIPNQVMIVGGSRIGYHTARLLESRTPRTRLIEQNPERAQQLAEQLSKTTVFEHDATDVEFLLGERIDEVDVVVTTLESDEQNLLMAILAKQLGADRTVAVVETGAYAGIFEAVGIDVAVNPRGIIAEEIIRFTYDIQAEKVSLIEDQEAQVFELEVTSESRLAGRPVREIVSDLSAPIVIGAITREGDVILPRGDTVIEIGDHVVIFAAGNIETVTAQL